MKENEDIRQRMELEQELEMTVLMEMEGLEVLENLGGEFVKFYGSLTNEVKSQPIDKANVVIITGRSGGKDTIASQLFRYIERDESLYRWQALRNRRIKLNYIPFADCEAAAMIEKRVNTPRGEHTEEDYKRISGVMWDVAGKSLHVSQPEITVIQIPTPTAYISKKDGLVGTDRGVSVMETLAKYKYARFVFIDADPTVHQRAKEIRYQLSEALKTGDPVMVLQVLKEQQMSINMGTAAVLNWSNLNDEEILKMAKDIIDSSASPKAIERSDSEFEEIKKNTGVSTDKRFYKFLARSLGIRDNRVFIFSNTMLGMDINQYRGRLNRYNIVRKNYPQIGRVTP